VKRASLMLAALALLLGGERQARADIIAGPSSFPVIGSNDTSWGIQFTALQNSTLTGFDYHHHPDTFGQPFTGTISLKDLTSNTTVYSTNYNTGTPTIIPYTGLNIPLTAGDVYQLVATSSIVSNANDEVFTYSSTFGGSFPPFPVANSDISVTQGVFNNNPGFTENNAWAAFGNITTSAAAVPEPTSLALFGMTIGAAGLFGWRRRKQAACA
jgi:hypothetical protein